MATEKDGWGKLLGHLRVDRGELLQDMAKNAGISTTYFSAIESGDRDIPVGLTEKIATSYSLSAEQYGELRKAELERSRKAVQIDMTGITDLAVKDAVLNFAAKAPSLTTEKAERINKILMEGSPYLQGGNA